jgi:pyridoxal 5'-phosphate synthase pdxS subunit
VARTGKLPVPNFAAGGVATPADAALMMLLGAEAVFVGSGIFKAGEGLPEERRVQEQERRARAIVQAVANYNRPEVLAQVSQGLGIPMKGLEVRDIPEEQLLAKRGW